VNVVDTVHQLKEVVASQSHRQRTSAFLLALRFRPAHLRTRAAAACRGALMWPQRASPKAWGPPEEEYQEREEVRAGAVLQDDVRDVLARLAEARGSWALLIVHPVHLVYMVREQTRRKRG
jgi:hypothetical protein